MPLMDEFKEEREEIKNRSLKEKMSYFWDYYKWHVIGGAVGLLVVISLIHTLLTRKDTAYYAAFVNMGETVYSDDYRDGFAAAAGINLDKEAVYFDAGLMIDYKTMDEATVSATQKLMVYIAAGDLDSMIADTDSINQYAYNGALMDMREFLTPEELERYEPYFFYMDRGLLTEDSSTSPLDAVYPDDPLDPSAMEDPVPVAIRINECQKLGEAYGFADHQYFSVCVNSKRQELNHVFLRYLWEQ